MSNVETTRPRGRFDVALMAGFFWAIVGVFVVSMASLAYVGFKVGRPPNDLLTVPLAAVQVALIAAFVGILPTSLFAGAIGWVVYRAGIVSRWAYLVVGALSAFLAIASWDLFLALASGDQPVFSVGDLRVYLFLYLPLMLVGAFGGYMGGRVLERA
ncbi:MAG: hypothetical protein SGI91_08735 [Alphaproteobacteria bacterium]|jgi:hypothetical protein|nr:hypothetical protein [Alphaproteobacteria bacterium]